jgi:hypothetical protein
MSAGSKAGIAPSANEVGSCPSNGHQLRERHADIEAEKGHSDDLCSAKMIAAAIR